MLLQKAWKPQGTQVFKERRHTSKAKVGPLRTPPSEGLLVTPLWSGGGQNDHPRLQIGKTRHGEANDMRWLPKDPGLEIRRWEKV